MPQRSTPCLARLTAAREWDRTIALRVGAQLVGVRVTRGESGTVELLFRDCRAPEYDARVAPNFSVELARQGGRAKALDLVYRDHVIMARRRGRDDLLADLSSLVAAAGHPEDREHLAIRASALKVGTNVTLLPAAWHQSLLMHQERLPATGAELLAPDLHLVTHDRAELVHPTPGADGGLDRLPITTWGLRVDTGQDRELRPSQAIQLGFFSVANLESCGPRATLDTLLRMAERATVVGLRGRGGADQVATARELARTVSSATTGGLVARTGTGEPR